MKRSREDDGVAVCSYQSPLRPTTQRNAPVAALGGHGAEITPTKRQRDRSIPMDAMTRLMTAATSAARMKKRAQLTLTGLFGAAPATVPWGGCAVCAAQPHAKEAMAPAAQLQRCAHCERMMGPCCARECDGCASAFCSLCSTINCDEQYDRVFCLSCNYDVSR